MLLNAMGPGVSSTAPVVTFQTSSKSPTVTVTLREVFAAPGEITLTRRVSPLLSAARPSLKGPPLISYRSDVPTALMLSGVGELMPLIVMVLELIRAAVGRSVRSTRLKVSGLVSRICMRPELTSFESCNETGMSALASSALLDTSV